MAFRLNKDMAGGAVTAALGVFVSLYGLYAYDLGTVQRMGTGMVPVGFGVILTCLGIALFLQSLLASRERDVPAVTLVGGGPRPLFFVLAGIVVFAATLRPLGVGPAIVLLVLISSRADGALTLLGALVLAVALAATVYLIFGLGLGLPIRFFRWPM